MNDFITVAQNLTVALRAFQMYTAAHPRSQQSLATSQAVLEQWLAQHAKLEFMVTGPKAFVNGEALDIRNPHISTLAKLIFERGISGFSVLRGIPQEEILVLLRGLAIKPAALEEQGGFDGLLKTSGVLHLKVSRTRYQAITEGKEAGAGEEKAPAFSPAAPSQPSEELIKFMRAALMASISKGIAAAAGSAGDQPGGGWGGASSGGSTNLPGGGWGGLALGGAFGKSVHQLGGGVGGTAAGGGASGSPGDADGTSPGGASGDSLEQLVGFGPADLSGLSLLGMELGLGEGMPTPGQFGTLRHIIKDLSPEAQLSLLAGLGSLPAHPAGLSLGMNALAGEILTVATSRLLAQGTTWAQLRGPIQDILRPMPDRERLVHTLTSHLRVTGQDATQAEAILRHLAWEQLSLEAKLVKALEEGYLYELSLEARLALLRELLDLRRFHEFLHIQKVLIDTLRDPLPDLRFRAMQTLTGMAYWALDPGLPPGGEGTLAEALKASFASESEASILRWTLEAIETVLTARIQRGEFGSVIAVFLDLERLPVPKDDQRPLRQEGLAHLRASLERPQLLDLVIARAFALERDQMIRQLHPYLEFIGDPMARQMVSRLGEETDRTRRGRLVEAIRSLGATSVPALMDAVGSSVWYLVRNALTLLSDLGDKACVPAILPLLRHPEPRVRRTAVRALWKLDGAVAEHHLLARMKDTDGETMQEILFVLGQLRSESCLPQVTELAQDKRVLLKLRIQALDTLGQIASPKALPTLRECMRRKGLFQAGEPSTIRLAAAKALAALGTDEARALLRKAADSEPAGEDREALRRLLEGPVAP